MLAAVFLATIVASAAPPPGPVNEAMNALALENGTILVTDGGSYGGSTAGAAWSAWALSDGNDGKGWCSPKGKPTGLEFVWELDTTWRLDTFVISTTKMQEGKYPGISAKSVEVWTSDGTAFRKAGAFEIGRESRKEFSLPAGTAARQVKLVVTGNHGNKEYTEIAEVELFGARVGPVATPKLAGDWVTKYGRMRFVVDGEDVYGCYDFTAGATVDGSLAGRTARVTWTEPKEGSVRQGTATFAVTADGSRLWGVWYEEGRLKGSWDGRRAGAREAATCTPRKKGSQLEALRKQGRVVLYGIRFDSGSDVPRPESNATLDEVAGTLKQDPKLRLLVEGHTDSTNTDAYNLDLSQRRAQAVVALLVKRGVDAGRLKAEGFGRTKPVADNETAQGRSLNRRVEISILR